MARSAGHARSVEPSPFFEPRVRFGEDFGRRLEQLMYRRGAQGASREGRGAARIQGAGEEFTGFSPYRPGDDLRQLDWDLLARLDMPFVRTTRREATEAWTVLIDGSASMGVGPPPKFQRAAELAVALAHVASSGGGAEVTLRTNRERPGGSALAELAVRRPEEVHRVREWFEGTPAGGQASTEELLAGAARSGRLIVIGDFLDLEPAELVRLSGRGRDLVAVCLLSPEEFIPALGASEFIDPESGESVAVQVDARLQSAYVSRLEQRLEAFSSACAKRRMRFVCHDTRVPFEDLLLEVLEGRRGPRG